MVLDEAQTRSVQPESRLRIDGQRVLHVSVCFGDFALAGESAAQCMVHRCALDALRDLIGEMPLRLRRATEQDEAMGEIDVQVDRGRDALQCACVAFQVLRGIAMEPDRVVERLMSFDIVGAKLDGATIGRQCRFVLAHVDEDVAAAEVHLGVAGAEIEAAIDVLQCCRQLSLLPSQQRQPVMRSPVPCIGAQGLQICVA